MLFDIIFIKVGEIEMDKEFYRIPLDESNPYKFVCLISNYERKAELGNVVVENSFGFSIGINYLYSISKNQQTFFENFLKRNNIAYENLKLNSQYQEYKKNQIANEPLEDLDSSFLCDEKMDIFLNVEIPQIICGKGETRVLLEEEVVRKDKIKIYVHSNEMCGHHLPHVHVKYNDNDNYCVVNLVDNTVLLPPNLRNAKTKEICELLNHHIQTARAAWNRTNSLLKFIMEGEEYTSSFVKSPH